MKVSISWLRELVETLDINTATKLLEDKTIPIKEVTPEFFELDMKGYNRADLLSMRGVAKEIAAITDSATRFTDQYRNFVWEKEDEDEPQVKEHLSPVKVQVESKQTPLYCVAKIEGLKVEKSPPEWVEKLESCGMRSINTIADITNLVMLEYGQPLHAFDADNVKDETIIVREAEEGEEIITLDDKKRVLSGLDLVIADPEKVVGIAGVMGGLNSEVTDSTTTIFLEAAIFDSATIRKTATRLTLSSEASRRFIHGLTRTNLFQALNTAIESYQKLGGKLTGIYLSNRQLDTPRQIPLNLKKINDLIGVTIPSKQVEKYLTALNCQLATPDDVLRGWEVTVPYWRLDINIEEDLIEEVARIYGYEKIPTKPLEGQIPPKIDQSLFQAITELKKALCETGLTEVQTYSFYSTAVLKSLSTSLEKLVKLANPISSETEYLRTNIWPNLTEVLGNNLKSTDDIAIFEIGKVYEPQDNTVPREPYKLSLALSNNTDNPAQELYQLLLQSLDKLGFNITAENTGQQTVFHPIRSYKISNEAPRANARGIFSLASAERNLAEAENSHSSTVSQPWSSAKADKGNVIGFMAEIHPRMLYKLGIDKKVAIAEIDLPRELQ